MSISCYNDNNKNNNNGDDKKTCGNDMKKDLIFIFHKFFINNNYLSTIVCVGNSPGRNEVNGSCILFNNNSFAH